MGIVACRVFEVPKEGLLLLQQAWDHCDITSYLAWRYKLQTKLLYVVQLFLAWLIVLASQIDDRCLDSESEFDISFADIGFVLCILSGAAVSIEGIYRPKPRWQALRAGHLSLVSMIWRYRARVGHFRLAKETGKGAVQFVE